MGLRDRRGGGDSATTRYQMREQLLSIGDDYWIEDASGNRAFKVDGKAVRVRDTFVLRDATGNEAAKIQERAVRLRDTMEIERPGANATVHKALVGLRDRYKIDVDGASEISTHGNLVDHEYVHPLGHTARRIATERDAIGHDAFARRPSRGLAGLSHPNGTTSHDRSVGTSRSVPAAIGVRRTGW
jgi:uncharacterized protein YxjI